MRIPLLVSILFLSLAAPAQRAGTEPSPEAEAFFQKAMRSINIRYKNKVIADGNKLRGQSINTDSLKSAVQSQTTWAVLGSMNGQDIEAIAFLVLMQAAKSAQEDLKSIMANVKAINNAKAEQRKKMQTAKQKDSLKLIRILPDTPANKSRVVTDTSDAHLELQQMRMQLYMDRRSKTIEALSNLFKKISSSQEQIISNLK